MILRNQIGDRVIITAPNFEGWFSTNVYQLNDDGEMSLWLIRKDRPTADSAKYCHAGIIEKLQPKPIQHCHYCNEVARNFDGVMKQWLCSHHFNLYIKERG